MRRWFVICSVVGCFMLTTGCANKGPLGAGMSSMFDSSAPNINEECVGGSCPIPDQDSNTQTKGAP